MDKYFPLQGCPQTITSDNDPAFASETMNAVYTAYGMNHITTASYHPQSNKVERSHRFLSEYFKKNIEDEYRSWDDVLPRIIMTYQCTPGENGLCPLEIHLNRDISLPYDYLFGVQRTYTGTCDATQMLQEQHKRFIQARQNLLKNQDYNVAYQKRKVNCPEFKLFDNVMIKDCTQAPAGTKKLRPTYLPDFKIIRKLGDYTYAVENIKNGRQYKRHANELILASNETAWHKKYEPYVPPPIRKRKTKYYDEIDTDPIIHNKKMPTRESLHRKAKVLIDDDFTSSDESQATIESPFTYSPPPTPKGRYKLTFSPRDQDSPISRTSGMATPPGSFRKIETDLKYAADSLRPDSQMSQDDKTQGSTQMKHTTHKHSLERKRAMEQEVQQNKHQRLDTPNDEVYAGLSGPMDHHTTHKHSHERKRAMEQEVQQNKHQRLDEPNDEVYAGLSGPMDFDSRESSDESMAWDEVMSCQQKRE
jgi:hypothetical protein